MDLFKKLKWTDSRISMLTDDSSGEFPVYHRKMADEFKKNGITLARQDLLPKKRYLLKDARESDDPNAVDRLYGKVSQCVILEGSITALDD